MTMRIAVGRSNHLGRKRVAGRKKKRIKVASVEGRGYLGLFRVRNLLKLDKYQDRLRHAFPGAHPLSTLKRSDAGDNKSTRSDWTLQVRQSFLCNV